MTLTANTRSCQVCGRMLPEEPPYVCGNTECSRIAVPLLAEWNPDLKRWLVGSLVASFFEAWGSGTPQFRWERLLTSVISGRMWDGRLVPRAASTEECWAIAHREAEAWAASGRPPLFD